MNLELHAILEASILHSCGVDLRTTYEQIIKLWPHEPKVVTLFESLLNEWKSPYPNEKLMFVGPFREREKLNSDYAIFTAFSEVGSLTTMMSEFWIQGIYAYLLKRKIQRDPWTGPDLLFACQLLGVFEIGDPLRNLFAQLNDSPVWRKGIFEPPAESVNFQQWLESYPVQTPPLPFRLEQLIRIEMERAGLEMEFLENKKKLWTEISSRLENLK